MKILITTDLYKPSINGVVTSITNLEKELKEQGHEVRILTVSPDSSSHQEGNVYYVKSMPSYIYPEVRVPFSRANAMVKELIGWKPDVVHSQCEFLVMDLRNESRKQREQRWYIRIIRYMNNIRSIFHLENVSEEQH